MVLWSLVISVAVGVVGSRLGLVLGFGGNGSSEFGGGGGDGVAMSQPFFFFSPFVVVVVVGTCRKHIILKEYITK